ncbi:TadE family protein [Duganella sp. S19_KUP01_CR8]|uniref:TadE family protein n=1 Tax=Duganella sp. S19_KUP01_CR8 TaxID=3025502 RepID=UPI002FCDC5C2
MSRPNAPRRPRGIAAVEMALILPTFVLLLALPLFLGRALYHYQIMHRAAHDAARYLSSCTALELRTPARTAAVVAAARAIAAAELEGTHAGSSAPAVSISCDGAQCTGLLLPTVITVQISTVLEDDVFPYYSYNLVGTSGMPLVVPVSMHYVGN